ncbi:MAG: methyltransferase domain-containing protein [Pirellulales bacterium]
MPDDAEVAHLLIALRDDAPPELRLGRLYPRPLQTFRRVLRFQHARRVGIHRSRSVDRRYDGRVREFAARRRIGSRVRNGVLGADDSRRAGRLVGVDLSPEMLEKTRKRKIYDRLDLSEATAWLGFARDERFDWIGICDMLIYFGDLGPILRAVRRLLKPNGIVGFTVEKGESSPFAFTDSGRFTHHPDHVRDVAATTGCRLVMSNSAIIRYEYGAAVEGLVTVLRNDA